MSAADYQRPHDTMASGRDVRVVGLILSLYVELIGGRDPSIDF